MVQCKLFLLLYLWRDWRAVDQASHLQHWTVKQVMLMKKRVMLLMMIWMIRAMINTSGSPPVAVTPKDYYREYTSDNVSFVDILKIVTIHVQVQSPIPKDFDLEWLYHLFCSAMSNWRYIKSYWKIFLRVFRSHLSLLKLKDCHVLVVIIFAVFCWIKTVSMSVRDVSGEQRTCRDCQDSTRLSLIIAADQHLTPEQLLTTDFHTINKQIKIRKFIFFHSESHQRHPEATFLLWM